MNTTASPEDLATELCTHLFPDAQAEAALAPRLEDPGEVAFLTRYLNGPGADYVMATRTYRWISIHADDLAGIATFADLTQVLSVHICGNLLTEQPS